ncbi:Lsr2 family DNA-binding protein [Amycolatopsis sp. H20-H5]
MRRWAQANGHTVFDRGRLPTAVRQAANTAH